MRGLFLIFLLNIALLANAQDIAEISTCMECHSDEEITGTIGGEEVLVFIDQTRFEQSVHADFSCVDCHEDIEDAFHEEDLKPVDCGMCHEDQALELASSVHIPPERNQCASCHGNVHYMLPRDNPESTLDPINIIKQCSTCHDEEQLDAAGNSLNTYHINFMESVHGRAIVSGNSSAANCIDCHGAHNIVSSDDENSPINHFNVAKTCAKCHEDIDEIYETSIHATSIRDGEKGPATCTDCHGEHDILRVTDSRSPMIAQRIYAMCGKCHFDVALMDQYGLASSEQETLFKGSVHAEEVKAGNENAPTCTDCHGFHDVLPLSDPKSPSNFMNVANTCGQCHETEKDQFWESVHGVSVKRGHKDSPVCTDCHGEHAILRTEDENSPVSLLNLSQNTCARCHASIVINDKYGIEHNRVSSYNDSYHGLAVQHNSERAANCSSCHGNHHILHSSNPKSTVSKERLVETCGKCHPGIGDNVLAAPIHTDITLRSDAIQAWVPRIYLVLIVVVIGGMLLHNGVIIWALFREKYRREKTMDSYPRFNWFEIVMHVLLTVSFILLAITGFALTSPNSWWVTMLSYLYMTEEVRGWIHRVSGVTLIVISFMYAFYMLGTRRGREEFVAFFPVLDDIVHVFQHIGYHLGYRDKPPKFDRYDYTEKMEFWALVWGVIIMAATGLILWFPILAFEYLPKWAIDIAELIHYYEAVLATLAIIIWHFFFVIFHPEQYPMSTTWLTGKMTLDQLRHHHPKEYERVIAQMEQEKGKE